MHIHFLSPLAPLRHGLYMCTHIKWGSEIRVQVVTGDTFRMHVNAGCKQMNVKLTTCASQECCCSMRSIDVLLHKLGWSIFSSFSKGDTSLKTKWAGCQNLMMKELHLNTSVPRVHVPANTGRQMEVWLNLDSKEAATYSPVQELISLTLTELLEAREAPVEIIFISSLRQAGGGLGGW